MTHPILNIDELEYADWANGEDFAARFGLIGARVGAQKLGYRMIVLPPGKRAFPLHSHRTNEEMFFVLEGSGEMRVGQTRHPLRSGDIVACPPGGPETAHQIVNTSATDDMKYLAVSTRITPEVSEYPDSGKFGLLVETPGADGKQPEQWRFFGRPDGGLDYWDGE